MTPKQKITSVRLDYALIGIMVLMLVTVVGISVAQLSKTNQHWAQATPQTEPAKPFVPSGNDNGPAESEPGGTRPTTPSPEPARPDSDAQKAGAQPALPAAPAEKMGAPVKH
ncbi:MAG: hypothetical protein K2W78_14205 [Xanthobacteraceae bacterium]|nr:hypothetical protein [Xanthobacteraceae bacterium]